jgi:hypothetical protein
LVSPLTLGELVFLHCKFCSIFLLQQEQASAPRNTVVINPMKYSCDKQQWYLNSFLLGVKLWEELHEKSILNVLIFTP